MNILILHQMGDPGFHRKAVYDLEFCLPHYAPEHNYIVHDGLIPLPDFVRDIEFDGIILGTTFLGNRYSLKRLKKVLKHYDFVRQSSAIKIALPQDDYDCCFILDKWMVDWNVDILYPVCSENWDILYPLFSKKGILKLGYTGFISEEMINRWCYPKSIEQRKIDVSYRVSNWGRNFGFIGNIKTVIGDLFFDKVKDLGFHLDLSSHAKDMIPGHAWHDFLEDSRFVLGANSGSSLLDPKGEIKKKVNRYLTENPNASFAETEAACYPGEDGRFVFTALSPRNIESAIIKSVQILTPGRYSDILQPHKHYLPLEPDLSNINDIIKFIRDLESAKAIANACKEAILSVDALRFTHHVSELIKEIENGISRKKHSAKDMNNQKALFQKHEKYIEVIAKPWWILQRLLANINKTIVLLGIKK